MALLLGIDPVVYASRSGLERVWTDVVVRRAWELHAEELSASVQAGAMARAL